MKKTFQKKWLTRNRKYKKDLWCEHCLPRRECLKCWGDGTEVVKYCKHCKTNTWHRGDRCLKCRLYNKNQPILFKIH